MSYTPAQLAAMRAKGFRLKTYDTVAGRAVATSLRTINEALKRAGFSAQPKFVKLADVEEVAASQSIEIVFFCTECGEVVELSQARLNQDAGNASHAFHQVCWDRFVAWLNEPIE